MTIDCEPNKTSRLIQPAFTLTPLKILNDTNYRDMMRWGMKRLDITHRKCPDFVQDFVRDLDRIKTILAYRIEYPHVDRIFRHERILRDVLSSDYCTDYKTEALIDAAMRYRLAGL